MGGEEKGRGREGEERGEGGKVRKREGRSEAVC